MLSHSSDKRRIVGLTDLYKYPGYPSHSGTPADTENFKLLLNDVRAKLDELGSETGRFYGLTAALPCGPNHIENMDIVHVGNTLSELNLMTYDFHGAFSDVTGVNAPLYFQGWGDPDFNLHSCVENWLKSGVDRKKINIGLPFYGRSAGGATGLNQPHSGADKSAWGVDEGERVDRRSADGLFCVYCFDCGPIVSSLMRRNSSIFQHHTEAAVNDVGMGREDVDAVCLLSRRWFCFV